MDEQLRHGMGFARAYWKPSAAAMTLLVSILARKVHWAIVARREWECELCWISREVNEDQLAFWTSDIGSGIVAELVLPEPGVVWPWNTKHR